MFYVGIAMVLLLQLGFIYFPPANALFGSMALTAEAWTKSIAVGAVILPAIVVEKQLLQFFR
jgi:hypothetical protein